MLGFIGLGVMGAPMCRNLAAKAARKCSPSTATWCPKRRWTNDGVKRLGLDREFAEHADIFSSRCRAGSRSTQVCLGEGGLADHLQGGRPGDRPQHRAGATWRADLTRASLRAASAFADAPVARTRQRRGRHAVGDGRRHRSTVRAHRAAARLHGERHHLLRRAGRRPGDEDHQQHGAVPERGGAGRGAGPDPACRSRSAARFQRARQGLGRQLRAATQWWWRLARCACSRSRAATSSPSSTRCLSSG